MNVLNVNWAGKEQNWPVLCSVYSTTIKTITVIWTIALLLGRTLVGMMGLGLEAMQRRIAVASA